MSEPKQVEEMNIAEIRAALADLVTGKLKSRIDGLSTVYGSRRKMARALGIDHVYLYRLARGDKINPSPAVLQKLGLL